MPRHGKAYVEAKGQVDREHERFLIHTSLIADPFNLQLLFETLGDALHHVGDEAAGQSMQSTVEPFVIGTAHADHLGLVVVFDAHVRVAGQFELALGTLNPHRSVGHLDLDPGRIRNRLLPNS